MHLSSEKQTNLVLKNRGLVYYIVNQLKVPASEYDDFASVGTIGLIKAAITFDESKEIRFASYASQCIRNEIFMYLRKNKNENLVSLDEPIIIDLEDGTNLTVADLIPSEESYFADKFIEREEFIELVCIVLNLFKPREKLILLYGFSNFKQREIAEIVNVSQSYISRMQKQLSKKLKEKLTSGIRYTRTYDMEVTNCSYEISFPVKIIPNFNEIFVDYLQEMISEEDSSNFEIIYGKEKVTICVPAELESFAFIAQVIEKLDKNKEVKKRNNI